MTNGSALDGSGLRPQDSGLFRSILFVCLGNICRSPMAMAVLRHQVAARPDAAQWRIASAGTGAWHIGKPADRRTVAELERHGVPAQHRARQVVATDFTEFDLLLAMDGQNLADLQRLAPPSSHAELRLLGEFDPRQAGDVPDPYYDGPEAFSAVYEQVERCCLGLLARLPPG